MPTLYICKGLPASGKSTWAKKHVAESKTPTKRVNRDDLRAMADPDWSPKKEKYIEALRDNAIAEALAMGFDVISDDTNLKPEVFEHVRQCGLSGGATIVVKDFTHISIEECIERDQKRDVKVGEKVIREMAKRYASELKLNIRQPLVPIAKPGLDSALLCDLDGTLALFNGRGPYDTAKCDTDILSIPVAMCLESLRVRDNFRIILMSGREEKFREKTEAWLEKNNIEYDALHMRATGDRRKDSIVKRELFETHVQDKYNIMVVFDDRDQVVRMWRNELGLVVFQVADGNF